MNRRSFLRILPVAPIAAPAAALQAGQDCLPTPPPLVVPPADRLSGSRFFQFVLELAQRAGIKVELEQEARPQR